MAFYESPRFPDHISFGARGGRGIPTTVTQTGGGREYRNQNVSAAKGRWVVGLDARRETDIQSIQSHHAVMRSRLHGFRFKDWADFTALSGFGILADDGDSPPGDYQMYKRYVAGSNHIDRIITKPVAGKFTILGTGTYATDTTTGLVTVSSGSAPTGWYGDFDTPVRYDGDWPEIEIIDGPTDRRIMGWSGIAIVEINPRDV